jgi:hypothetical protein
MRTSVTPALSATQSAGWSAIREIVCHCRESPGGKRSTGAVLRGRVVTGRFVGLRFATAVDAATVVVAAASDDDVPAADCVDVECPAASPVDWDGVRRAFPQPAGSAAARATIAAMRGRRTEIMIDKCPSLDPGQATRAT